MQESSFWQESNSKNASRISKEHFELQKSIDSLQEIEQTFQYSLELHEMAKNESESEMENENEELIKECKESFEKLLCDLKNLQTSIFLSDESDNKGCFVQVSAGSGGLEAQEWCLVLFEMFEKWCTFKDFDYTVLLRKETDAGLSQGVLEIKEEGYGWLKWENGVHRRTRISTFGRGGMQTSFSGVSVSPNSLSGNRMEIDEKDVSWEAMRGHGPGGQHKNTTNR